MSWHQVLPLPLTYPQIFTIGNDFRTQKFIVLPSVLSRACCSVLFQGRQDRQYKTKSLVNLRRQYFPLVNVTEFGFN